MEKSIQRSLDSRVTEKLLFLRLGDLSNTLFLSLLGEWRGFGQGLVIFRRLGRDFINALAFWAFYHYAQAESKADLSLAASTYKDSIKRFALIKILTRSTAIYLSIAWNILRYCAKLASYFSKIFFHLHHGNTWFFWLFLLPSCRRLLFLIEIIFLEIPIRLNIQRRIVHSATLYSIFYLSLLSIIISVF